MTTKIGKLGDNVLIPNELIEQAIHKLDLQEMKVLFSIIRLSAYTVDGKVTVVDVLDYLEPITGLNETLKQLSEKDFITVGPLFITIK